MTNYAMVCDHRDYLHQWADEIIEIIPDDIYFENESRERIVGVLVEFEFALKRTYYQEIKKIIASMKYVSDELMIDAPTRAAHNKTLDDFIEEIKKNKEVNKKQDLPF